MTKLFVAAALSTLGALTGCTDENASDVASSFALSKHLDSQAPSGTFRFSDVYGDDVTAVRVVCPYTEDDARADLREGGWKGAEDLALEEGEQAVVTFDDDGALDWEVLGREQLDLCAGNGAEPGDRLDPATELDVVEQEWSDGTSVPSVQYR